MPKIFKNSNGFTLLEVIAVLVVMGILTAVVVSRSANFAAEVYTGADAFKNHLRYAQTIAMNKDPIIIGDEAIIGIHYDSGANQYWLFRGTDETILANIMLLPDDTQYATGDRKINLNAKKITLTGFTTIYFDSFGIPYSAYTDSTTNTPLADLLSITVSGGSSNKPINLTPLTGLIP